MGHFTYWVIFWSKVLKNFKHKNCLILNNYHEIIGQNLYKFWSQDISIPQETKLRHTPNLYTTDLLFYNSSINIESISFFSSSDTQKYTQHLLVCHATDINS